MGEVSGNDFIAKALRKAGVVGINQIPPGYLLTDGLDTLNDMLDSWSLESLMVLFKTEETFSLVAQTREYTIGDGGDFDTVRPIRLINANLKRDSRDYPLKVVERSNYNKIGRKQTSGRSFAITYQPEYPLGKIALFFTPDSSSDQLFLSTQKQLESFPSLTTKVNFAPGYNRAVKYNLAIELAGEFGRGATLDPTIIAIAKVGKDNIKNVNSEPIPRVPLESAEATGQHRHTSDPDDIKSGVWW